MKNLFAKYGEVVGVYMATKRDVNKKSFAFVKFKMKGDECKLEKALQRISFKGRRINVNIARFARKPSDVSLDRRNVKYQNQYKFPQKNWLNGRGNKTFSTVVADGTKSSRVPPLQPQLKLDPIKILDDSPLGGWMRCKLTLIGELHSFDHLEKAPYSFKNHDRSNCELKYHGGIRIRVKFMNKKRRDAFLQGWTEWFGSVNSGDMESFNFERITWLKILGLLLELWSEENFTLIAKLVGRVIFPFEVDQTNVNLSYGKVGVLTNSLSNIFSEPNVEINGRTIKIKIAEVERD